MKRQNILYHGAGTQSSQCITALRNHIFVSDSEDEEVCPECRYSRPYRDHANLAHSCTPWEMTVITAAGEQAGRILNGRPTPGDNDQDRQDMREILDQVAGDMNKIVKMLLFFHILVVRAYMICKTHRKARGILKAHWRLVQILARAIPGDSINHSRVLA